MLDQITFLLGVAIIGGLTSAIVTTAIWCGVRTIRDMVRTHEQYAILKSIIIIIILTTALVLLFIGIFKIITT